MKRFLKVLLIIFILIAVLIAAIALWQWKNIEGIVIGVKENQDEIIRRREDNQSQLIKDVNSLLDDPLREMTEEEKTKVQEGEMSVTEVYQQMFEEKKAELKTAEGSKPTPQKADNSAKKDEIVSRYMSELYQLQNEFTAKAEATIAEGANYYESINAHPQDPVARANTIKKFTPVVRGIEKDCDGKVENVIARLKSELESIGADTSITETIRKTYANEKQLKLSYYANKYLK